MQVRDLRECSMKQFCCGDVVPGCKAVFQAHDEAFLLGQIATHARVDHGFAEIPAGLLPQIRAKIRDLNVVA